jgi:hypothetical protein
VTLFISVSLPSVASPNWFISKPPGSGEESEFCPPVFEYTCVSSIMMLTFGRFCRTTFETFWKPMSPIPPSPPTAHTFGSSRISRSVMSVSVM